MKDVLLCVIAHPDDETMLTGGVLACLDARGVAVHILCATRGEGGELGEPPVCTREALGSVREAELRCAAAALGATSVDFLDYVDPQVTPGGRLRPFRADPAAFEAQIAMTIEHLEPSIVLTHGSAGEYGHPAHVLVHETVTRAHRAARIVGDLQPPALVTFCAALPDRQDRIHNQADPADVVVDVTPWLGVKSAAAACHRTQHALFFRNHPEARTFREVLRPVEGLHLVWSPDGALPPLLTDWEAGDDD